MYRYRSPACGHHRRELLIDVYKRQVYDVSGAGDTVVATLAAALAAGIPIADAIYLAHKAAGLVVGKIGTSPILFKALQDELQIGKPASKLIPLPQLADTTKHLRAQERKIIFTNGCFDILHKGHVCYLEKAKSCLLYTSRCV